MFSAFGQQPAGATASVSNGRQGVQFQQQQPKPVSLKNYIRAVFGLAPVASSSAHPEGVLSVSEERVGSGLPLQREAILSRCHGGAGSSAEGGFDEEEAESEGPEKWTKEDLWP